MTSLLDVQPALPDTEAAIMGRLVEMILTRWPCPRCGQPGLCMCFDDEPQSDQGEGNRRDEDGQPQRELFECLSLPDDQPTNPHAVHRKESAA